MKYIILLADGMAGWPINELNGQTTLEKANTPNMNYLAANGEIGMVKTTPEGMSPGSDVTNMGLFGYEPEKYYTGRAPLEALSMGIDLGENDVAFRCNLVNLLEYEQRVFMNDYSAGHISTEEGKKLIEDMNEFFNFKDIKFFPGVSYRHICVFYDCPEEIANLKLYPPHDIIGEPIIKYLPEDWTNNPIVWLITQAQTFLAQHEINKKRIEQNKLPANSIWLWGQGKKPAFESFKDRFGLTGAVIAAVDLIKGIGGAAGLDIINVEGATGYLDTNYEGKAQAAIEALKDKDFVYLHVEASDEAGHEGSIEKKIKAIEYFDKRIVEPVFKFLKDNYKNFKILITADHPTPIEKKTHTNEPVPFIIFDSRKSSFTDSSLNFSEKLASKNNNNFNTAVELTKYFLDKG